MDERTEIKTLLESIQKSEGADFTYDEAAILKEYDNEAQNKTSLSIKILSFLGGYLATSTFLSFFALTAFNISDSGILFIGAISIISALVLDKISNRLITETFSTSLFLSGFGFLIYSLYALDLDEISLALLVSLIAFSTFFISTHSQLSFISILICNVSFVYLLYSLESYYIHIYIVVISVFLTYLYLNEAKIIAYRNIISRKYNILRIGMVFSFIIGLILISVVELLFEPLNYIWISFIILGLLSFYLVYIILNIIGIKAITSKIIIYFLIALLLYPTIYAPAITGAILIILLNFLVNYKTGFYIGVIAGVYFISQYYYNLNITLLVKSISLMVLGVVFILFYLFTQKRTNHVSKI